MSGARAADEAAFNDLLAHLPEPAARAVQDAMGEPWRRYHAPWHLGRMWRLHRAHGFREWDADLALAVGYHDIVYRPDAPRLSNEYRSAAAFLSDAAALDLRPGRAARIAAWIIASADHLGDGADVTPEADPAGAWFLDLDLEPLASPEFAANTALIRQEYAHIPDAAFAAGRHDFLRTLASAPRLFRTALAAQLGWEAAARHNLRLEGTA